MTDRGLRSTPPGSLFPALDVLDHLHDTWRGSRFVSGAEADGERALNELVLNLAPLIEIAHGAAEILQYGEHPAVVAQGRTQAVGKHLVSRQALNALEAKLNALCEELSDHER